MGEHTELPWCIPAGAQNGFIICAGDDPEKPGPILMIVSAPRGRSRVLTDADINNNTAFMVKAALSHGDLVKALQDIRGGSFEGASNLAVSGSWKLIAERLQKIAADALAQVSP